MILHWTEEKLQDYGKEEEDLAFQRLKAFGTNDDSWDRTLEFGSEILQGRAESLVLLVVSKRLRGSSRTSLISLEQCIWEHL